MTCRSLLKQTVREEIVVIDSGFPLRSGFGPRNADLLEFARQLPGFKYYVMPPTPLGPLAHYRDTYGMSREDFDAYLAHYSRAHPEADEAIRWLDPRSRYRVGLAYTYFLAETYALLPLLEQHSIPFVFLLSPGGGFGFDNPGSDAMLRAVVSSPQFRGVITNHARIASYLLDEGFCSREDVVFDPSGSVQFYPDEVVPRRHYPADKPTFDVCFVAAKYTPGGIDKGFDLFINSARVLARRNPDTRFHIVGGFSADDVDLLPDISPRFTFHGYLDPGSLPEFYSWMDVFLAPSRPSKLYQGAFDGFPLSAGAMYCGVCGVNTDELGLNTEFSDDEVVVVRPELDDIVTTMQRLIDHPGDTDAIAQRGQIRAQQLYDTTAHIERRIELLTRTLATGRLSAAPPRT